MYCYFWELPGIVIKDLSPSECSAVVASFDLRGGNITNCLDVHPGYFTHANKLVTNLDGNVSKIRNVRYDKESLQ